MYIRQLGRVWITERVKKLSAKLAEFHLVKSLFNLDSPPHLRHKGMDDEE
jgi:hypothetical protein